MTMIPGGGRLFSDGASNALSAYQPVLDRLAAEEPEPVAETVFEHKDEPQPPLSIWRLLSQHRKLLAVACIAILGFSLAQQVGPWLIQIAIDDGMGIGGNPWVILWTSIAFAVSVVLTVLFQRWQTKSTGRLASRALRGLRIRVFAHLQRLSMDYYGREKVGVILTRMTSDIESLQMFLQDGAAQLAVQLLTMVVIAVALILINPLLGLVTLAVVLPVLFGFSLWFRHKSTIAFSRVRDEVARVNTHLAESLHGVRVVTAHNRHPDNVEKHRSITGAYRAANLETGRLNAIYGPGTQFIGYAAQAGLLAFAGVLVINGTLEVGALVTYFLYLSRFFSPILLLVAQYSVFQQSQAAVRKIGTLLNEHPSVVEAKDAADLPTVDGELRLDHVSFEYASGRTVLSEVDITINPGETVAFVGPTGAGKSTIAKLASRFYDPTAGAVRIDGIDLRSVDIESLRRQIGTVPQESFLFRGTLRDNVAFAAPDASEETIRRAVEAVGLAEVVDRLPLGLDTVVHERGQSLSSGERQLVALARAFLADPRILILDEATSSLDLRSEAAVETALDTLLAGRTAIIIAHRLSTAMKADRVVVIDGGRVVESGPHSELMRQGGLYARMFDAWSKES